MIGTDSVTIHYGEETNAAVPCIHHFCGNSWIVTGSTTGGYPGGTRAWGICCKCGARSAPADSYVPVVQPFMA